MNFSTESNFTKSSARMNTIVGLVVPTVSFTNSNVKNRMNIFSHFLPQFAICKGAQKSFSSVNKKQMKSQNCTLFGDYCL